MKKSDIEPLVRNDPWLSQVLGRKALQVRKGLRAGDLTELATFLSSDALLATAKVSSSEVSVVHGLEDIGFHVVDTALVMRCDRLGEMRPASARFAKTEDRARIVEIARTAFRYSRFHLDPAIPNALADHIKAEWAGNFFAGQRGDAMITIDVDGEVAGFLQLLSGTDNDAVIDLIAVDPSFGRRGLARAMIGFAACHGIGDGVKPIGLIVGTQAANTPSVGLYENAGFRLLTSSFVLHHHGTQASYDYVKSSI